MARRSKPVVVVVSEGGVIQAIFSNLPRGRVEVIVVDHDLDESDDPAEREFYEACLKRAEQPFLAAEFEIPRWQLDEGNRTTKE